MEESEFVRLKLELAQEFDARLGSRLKVWGAGVSVFIALIGAIAATTVSATADSIVEDRIRDTRNEMQGFAVAFNVATEIEKLVAVSQSRGGVEISQTLTIMNGLDFLEEPAIRRVIRESGLLDRMLNRSTFLFTAAELDALIDEIVENYESDIVRNADTSDTLVRHYGKVLVADDDLSEERKQRYAELFDGFKASARSHYPETVLLYESLRLYAENADEQGNLSNINARIANKLSTVAQLNDRDREGFFGQLDSMRTLGAAPSARTIALAKHADMFAQVFVEQLAASYAGANTERPSEFQSGSVLN